MDCVVSGATAALSGLGSAAAAAAGGAADAGGALGGAVEALAGAPQGGRGGRGAGAGHPDVAGRGRNPYRVASGAEVDNVGESGEESEDEWNYYRVEPTGDKESAPQNPDSEDMESQLNPNAAVFIPSSPENSNHIEQPFNENLTQEEFFNKNDVMSSSFIAHDPVSGIDSSPMDVINGKDDEVWLSSSPKKGGVPLDNVYVPPEDEFDREVSQRPSDLDVENQLNTINGEAVVSESLQNGQKNLEDELCAVKDEIQDAMENSNPFAAAVSPKPSSELGDGFSLSCEENVGEESIGDSFNEVSPVVEPVAEPTLEPVEKLVVKLDENLIETPIEEPVEKRIEELSDEIGEGRPCENTEVQQSEAAEPFVEVQSVVLSEAIPDLSKDEFAEDKVADGDADLLNDMESSNGNFKQFDHSPIMSGATDIARDHINNFLEPPSFAQGLSSNDTSVEPLNDGVLYSTSGFDNMMGAPAMDLCPVSPSMDHISAQSTPFEEDAFMFKAGNQVMQESYSDFQLDKPEECSAVLHQTEAQIHSQFDQESNLVGEIGESFNLNRGFAEDSALISGKENIDESQTPILSENHENVAEFLQSEAVSQPAVLEEEPFITSSVLEAASELAVVDEEPSVTSPFQEAESQPAVVDEPFATAALEAAKQPVTLDDPFGTPAVPESENQQITDNEPFDMPVVSETVSHPVTFVEEQFGTSAVPEMEKPASPVPEKISLDDFIPQSPVQSPEIPEVQSRTEDFAFGIQNQQPVSVLCDIPDAEEETNFIQEKVDLVGERLLQVQPIVDGVEESAEASAEASKLDGSVSPLLTAETVIGKELINGLNAESSPLEPPAEIKLPEFEGKVETQNAIVEPPVIESAPLPDVDTSSQAATAATVGVATAAAAIGVAAAAVAASKTDKKPASKAPAAKVKAASTAAAKAPAKTAAKPAPATSATAPKRSAVPPVPAARAAPRTTTSAATAKPKPSEATSKPASAPKPAPPKPRTTLPASKPATTDRKPLTNGDAAKPAAAKPLARTAPTRPSTAPARTTAKPAASAAATKPLPASSTTAPRPPPIRRMPASTTAPKPKPAPTVTESKPKPTTTTSAAARPRPSTASSVSSARSTVPSARAAPASKPIDKQTKETTNKLISATRSTVSRTTTASKTTVSKSTSSASGTTTAASKPTSKPAAIKKPPTTNGTTKTVVGKKPSEKPKEPMTNGNVKNGHATPEPVQNGISHEPVIEKRESDLKIESLVDNQLVA